MHSNAPTVTEYLKSLPPERRQAIAKVRSTIRSHLPSGYKEMMQYGMISYCIPLSSYSNTYNKQPLCYAAIASQKNYMSLYLMNIYGDKSAEQWFSGAFKDAGKKLDMGKSCVRFKRAEDLPLEVIGKAIERTSPQEFITMYEKAQKKK